MKPLSIMMKLICQSDNPGSDWRKEFYIFKKYDEAFDDFDQWHQHIFLE